MIGDPFIECIDNTERVETCTCGPNGVCSLQNGNRICTYPECIINSDCTSNKACFNQKCRNPCQDSCGINAICNVFNHKAVCSCPQNYIGSPYIQCMVQKDTVRPECVADQECTNDNACINERCLDPCKNSQGLCALNAECKVQNHRAVCSCKDGFTGNAHYSCFQSMY